MRFGGGHKTRHNFSSPQLGEQMEKTQEVMHPLLFQVSDGRRLLVDWRDVEELMGRDPEGRTLPPSDPNELQLTADDCVFLWTRGIGF